MLNSDLLLFNQFLHNLLVSQSRVQASPTGTIAPAFPESGQSSRFPFNLLLPKGTCFTRHLPC